VVMGYPALTHRNYLKSYAVFKNLYDLQKTVQILQKEVETLKK
jgi:hypothetical protein